MKQTSWQIIYSNYSGIQKRVVEFLNKEMSKFLIRERELYRLHVLPVVQETSSTVITDNAIVIGLYPESQLIQKYVAESELDQTGYCVRVVDNPDNAEGSIVCITAFEETALYRGAAAFVDDYSNRYMPHLPNYTFNGKLTAGELKASPKCPIRGIFGWGHPINDYREYIRNMARIGLNEVILWNDFPPLNARDVVEYAHSFGISIIWGFAWGWDTTLNSQEFRENFSDELLVRLKKSILDNYNSMWRGLGDGIYFQSFTETRVDTFNGKLIAAVVTDFVNDVAGVILEQEPDLRIQFGLHATSVKNHLEEIARVDKRIEIVWEDCGAFPYDYNPISTPTEEQFLETLEFTKKIIQLRGSEAKTGLIFKGHAIMDWSNFIHQKGVYILGDNDQEILEHDKLLRKNVWSNYTAGWIKNGELARKTAQLAIELDNKNLALYMAGVYDGGIWFPEALCAEIFYDPYEKIDDLIQRIVARRSVKTN